MNQNYTKLALESRPDPSREMGDTWHIQAVSSQNKNLTRGRGEVFVSRQLMAAQKMRHKGKCVEDREVSVFGLTPCPSPNGEGKPHTREVPSPLGEGIEG